jgi:hypothetical protein
MDFLPDEDKLKIKKNIAFKKLSCSPKRVKIGNSDHNVLPRRNQGDQNEFEKKIAQNVAQAIFSQNLYKH